jgi:hypothetical protein
VHWNFTQRVESGACRLNHIGGIALGDSLRHDAAAGIPEADEENLCLLLFHHDFNL